jgi:hypothetical protein
MQVYSSTDLLEIGARAEVVFGQWLIATNLQV